MDLWDIRLINANANDRTFTHQSTAAVTPLTQINIWQFNMYESNIYMTIQYIYDNSICMTIQYIWQFNVYMIIQYVYDNSTCIWQLIVIDHVVLTN